MMEVVKKYGDLTSPEWAEKLTKLIPHHMQDAMALYMVKGVRPGSFLESLLSGSLFEAVRYADEINRRSLPVYVNFLVHYAPARSFGSPDLVEAWVRSGGLVGQEGGQ